jgi:hypothetical protein
MRGHPDPGNPGTDDQHVEIWRCGKHGGPSLSLVDSNVTTAPGEKRVLNGKVQLTLRQRPETLGPRCELCRRLKLPEHYRQYRCEDHCNCELMLRRNRKCGIFATPQHKLLIVLVRLHEADRFRIAKPSTAPRPAGMWREKP